MEDDLRMAVLSWEKRLSVLLELEKEKFERFPIKSVPVSYVELEILQAQPYISQGMNIFEQVLKCLIFRSKDWSYYQNFRDNKGHKLRKGHSLYRLWGLLSEEDHMSFRGWHQQWRQGIIEDSMGSGEGTMPFRWLDEFLIYLDGEEGGGSINWRYFSIDGKGFHPTFSQGGFTVYESPPKEMLTAIISLIHECISRGLVLLGDPGYRA